MCDGQSNNGSNAVARAVKQRDKAIDPTKLVGVDYSGNIADVTRQRQLPGARNFTALPGLDLGTGSAFKPI